MFQIPDEDRGPCEGKQDVNADCGKGPPIAPPARAGCAAWGTNAGATEEGGGCRSRCCHKCRDERRQRRDNRTVCRLWAGSLRTSEETRSDRGILTRNRGNS